MQNLTTTPAAVVRWMLGILVLGVLGPTVCAAPSNSTNAASASRLVEFVGSVQVTVTGTNDWHQAKTNQWLYPGDRLQTGRDSRATIQLSDRSTIRINQSTIIEIQPPNPPARHSFNLRRGAIYFLDREKPADIEFRTPLTSGAIRGTEFLLAVADAGQATFLALMDGHVELASSTEKLSLSSGQQIWVRTNVPAQVSAVLPMASLIQWSFYYPAVVNPADLSLDPNEKHLLANSLVAYENGDLIRALAEAPENMATNSANTRVYFAALKLAVGQVDAAEKLIVDVGHIAAPLRELIDAVKSQGGRGIKTKSETADPKTSSEWLARSYYLQSQSKLPEALNAAQQAARLAPDFGFAWARVAEQELNLEHRRAARNALRRARELSPRNAQAVALEGFLALRENHPRTARDWFNRAIAMDGSLPSAWLGRAVARARLGDHEGARRDLQIAATIEPTRGLFRSYLGKAWSQSGEDNLAAKDFALAKKMDPGDPTAWLYSALHEYQTHQINTAVRDLEHSVELNDNRGIFRSRLQLDRDLAARSADLAAIYNAAGLTDVSERAASRAVEESYSDFAGHLFMANSLRFRERFNQYDLRFESARESELLVANLLAPPGGGNLSQVLSEQDHLQYFDERPFGLSTLTEYGSGGDWTETASAFGHADGFSYALDSRYLSLNGQRANSDLNERQFSFQAKQQITLDDSLYLQVGYLHRENGDIARYYDPQSAIPGLRATEEQKPNLFLGWNHEWSPESHTLFLFSRLTDWLSLTNPQPTVPFIQQNGAGVFGVEVYPYFTLQEDTRFTLCSAEAQQIWETPHHAFILGARYQHGAVDTYSMVTRPIDMVENQSVSPSLERVNGYGYYQWHPVGSFRLTAGLSYDRLIYPQNADLPPVQAGEDQRSLLGPKFGLTWQPWRNGWLRGAWTRSLGGLFFDNSIRLEPAQVAGFTSAFRSLIPESTEGLAPGTKFDSWTIGFDQSLRSQTYFGIDAEWLASDGSRNVGAFMNTFPGILVPDGPTSTSQTLDFRERNLSAYTYQLIGDYWSVGARYRLSEAKLNTRLPELAGVPGVSLQQQDERAVLQHGQLFFLFNHPSGFFAGWSSDWYHQNNHGYTPALGNEDFWQHNIFAGYVFPHRRAELRVGLLNLMDQDYRLNPLNLQSGLPRGRTFTASLRMNF